MPDYLGTSVFVAFDGDHIGREVGRASLADDVEGLRKLSQAIEKGNQLWGSWALASMGTVVSLGGDEGRVEVPADKLGDIPDLRAQYHSAVGASVTVGVGMTLSEADKALSSNSRKRSAAKSSAEGPAALSPSGDAGSGATTVPAAISEPVVTAPAVPPSR